MGAWGYEPVQNDGSHDLLLPVRLAMEAELVRAFQRPLPKPLKARRARRIGDREVLATSVNVTWARWERVGFAQLLSERYEVGISLSILRQIALDLEACLADEVFSQGWRDPAAYRRSTKRMIKQVRVWIDHCTRPKKYRCGRVSRTRRGHQKAEPAIHMPLFGYGTVFVRRLLAAKMLRRASLKPRVLGRLGRRVRAKRVKRAPKK